MGLLHTSLSKGVYIGAMVRTGLRFSQLVNPDSIASLEAELGEDRERLSKRRAEFERLRGELKVLEESIERQKKVIEALRQAMPSDGEVSPEANGEVVMTKRTIATEILRGSTRPLFPREVRDKAVERGWIPESQAARNQLSVAMSKALRAGHFVKDGEGRYGLAEHR